MSSEKPNDMDVIKFLMECSYKEGTLFWNRNSVFLLANLAGFSAAFAYLTGSAEPISAAIRVGIGAFGVILCVIWILIVHVGRKMNHVWVHEAKDLAKEMGQPQVFNALNLIPAGSVSNVKKRSATGLMYWLAGLFMSVWICVSFLGKGGIA